MRIADNSAYDYNEDGKVNSLDAMMLLQRCETMDSLSAYSSSEEVAELSENMLAKMKVIFSDESEYEEVSSLNSRG